MYILDFKLFLPCKITLQVQLVPYNPDVFDESVLWTESKDMGGSFRSMRMINNIHLNFDALHGDKSHGSVHDYTSVVLNKWHKGDNQLWKITPYCMSSIISIDHHRSNS